MSGWQARPSLLLLSMYRRPAIQIDDAEPKSDAVIRAALITAAATLIAAIIVALASLRASWPNQPPADWSQTARAAGWIPRRECPWRSGTSVGTDQPGRRVEVTIHLLAAEYRWVYRSAADIELGGVKDDLASHIRNLTINPSAEYVVAVGVASAEGGLRSQAALAEARTDRLIRLIKDELHPSIPVHGLSLGRFIDESTRGDTVATASQRRVIIVEVLKHDVGVNLSEAIYDALKKAHAGNPPIPFNVSEYSDRKYTDHQFGNR